MIDADDAVDALVEGCCVADRCCWQRGSFEFCNCWYENAALMCSPVVVDLFGVFSICQPPCVVTCRFLIDLQTI